MIEYESNRSQVDLNVEARQSTLAQRGGSLLSPFDLERFVDSVGPIDRIERFPGAELIRKGIDDARSGADTREAALVQMAHEKLTAAGFSFPEPRFPEPAGHRLYDLISDDDRATAHGTYNALLGRLTSFLDALDHASAR